MTEAIGYVVAAVLIGGLLLVLGAIVRFSIISPLRTAGSRKRLRRPDAGGVERVCGFPVPQDLLSLYTTVPFVELVEFELVDDRNEPPVAWPIGQFIPLSGADASEWRTISRVPGVPLADDLDKGVYFLSATGEIILASPDLPGGRALVAENIRAFRAFTPRRIEGTDA